MKIDGASPPHGAPYNGCSTGAKKYRDKLSRSTNYLNSSNGEINNKNSAIITTSNNCYSNSSCNNNTLNNNYNNHNLDAKLRKRANTVKSMRTIAKSGSSQCNNTQSNSKSTKDDGLNNSRCGGGTSVRMRMRAQQSLMAGFGGFSFNTLYVLCLFYVFVLLPNQISCDDSSEFFVNSFSLSPETTTPEFDYASRGTKKFGDKCENTLECGFPGSICDPTKKYCQCTEDLPITNHIDKCGKKASVNESCFFNEQCEEFFFETECRDGHCVCRFELTPHWDKDGKFECRGKEKYRGPETYMDPAMIGVLVGMALMFIIICVVLRLFSQARWRENRTIFNTPNPRLMNVSLLRDNKLLHGQERRGSRMSVRAPSRQPSMASLRPHSPNPSLGSRHGSRGSSSASVTSIRSTRSGSVPTGSANHHHERKTSTHHQHQHQHHPAPHHHHQHQHHPHHHQQQQPLITNITSNPVAENVTVEIVEP